MAELQPLWHYDWRATEYAAMADERPLLRCYSRVAYTLPRSLAVNRHVLVFLVLENKPRLAQVGQGCTDRFCGFSLVRTKNGANTTAC